jgi:hypothetical protein
MMVATPGGRDAVRIVLTLVEYDLARYLRLQRPTFERFYADLDVTTIVTRSRDVSLMRSAVGGLRAVEVVDERDLVPERVLQWDPRPQRRDRNSEPTSWFFQQLVKLAAVAAFDDNFVLVLDGDVIAVAPVSDADLVVDGQALRPIEPVQYPAWINWAAETLDLPPLSYQAAVTPSVMSPAAVRSLAAFAETRVSVNGPRLRAAARVPGLRRLATSWRGRLLGHKWTEYQLYDTFLVGTGQFESFHRTAADVVLSANGVHSREDFTAWSLEAPPAVKHFFSVVQSRAQIPIADVEARLRSAAFL